MFKSKCVLCATDGLDGFFFDRGLSPFNQELQPSLASQHEIAKGCKPGMPPIVIPRPSIEK